MSWLPSNDNATRDTLTKETLIESSIAPLYISVYTLAKTKNGQTKTAHQLICFTQKSVSTIVFNVVVNLNLKTTSLRVLAINQSHFCCRCLSQHFQKHCPIHFGFISGIVKHVIKARTTSKTKNISKNIFCSFWS